MHVFERQGERLTLFCCFPILPNDPRARRMNYFLSIALALIFLISIVLALPFVVELTRYQDHYKPLIEHALNCTILLQACRPRSGRGSGASGRLRPLEGHHEAAPYTTTGERVSG
jgi:hypothetical protein